MKTLRKMLLLATTALAAAAFAAPGLAQADELISGGSSLEPGSPVELRSTNFRVAYTGAGTLGCNVVTLDAEVLENGPEAVELEVHGSKYENCSAPAVGKQAGTFIQLANGAVSMPDYAFDFTFCSHKGTLNGASQLGTSSLGVSGVLYGCYYGGANVSATFSLKDVQTGLPVIIN